MSPPQTATPDPILLALTRQRMAAVFTDSLQVAQACLQAASTGDYITLAAVDTAHKWDPLFAMPPEWRRQAERIRTSYEFPDASRELEALSAIDMRLRIAIDTAKRALGIEPVDPIKTLTSK